MTSKADQQVIKDEETAEKAYRKTEAPKPSAPIPAGCSEPETLPPSVVGTSQDPTRKKEKE
jgi:hypothetical protein